VSTKMGRPKTDNPINIRTSIRLDKQTDAKLTEYCIEKQISRGEAVREGIKLLISHKK